MRRAYWRHSIAILVGLMGLANILSSLLVRVPVREQILRDLLPLDLELGTRHLAVVAGLALLAVGRGLWRGKRWPWRLTIGLLVGSAVFHLAKGLDFEESAAALALAGVLIWQRDAFRAPADPPTLARAFRALALSIVLLVLYALLGGLAMRHHFAPPAEPGTLLQELGARLLLGVGPLQPASRRAYWFLDSFSVIGVAMLAYLLGAFLRPFVAPHAAPEERARALDLLRRYASSSLSYFALLPGKSLYFGRNVEGLVAFRVANAVAVACGDPIVAPEHLKALLDEFMQHCAAHGWDVCFYEVRASNLHIYQALGLRTLKIGEDAWIDLSSFTLKGKPIADIRHAVSKIERDGLHFAVLTAQALGTDANHEDCERISADQRGMYWEQMQAIAARENRGMFELEFSIGRLPAEPDPEARYTLALSPDHAQALGFCSWLPIFAVNGWALDVMQRAEGAPNGTMEYLIAQSLLYFQRDGATWASLGMAPLADADVDGEDDRSLLQRGLRFLYEHPQVNKLYRYKSLFFFKRKFVPVWRSDYLAFPSRLALPRILYAVLKVHLPSLGPALVTEFLLSQGGRGVERWRDWLGSLPLPGLEREAEERQETAASAEPPAAPGAG